MPGAQERLCELREEAYCKVLKCFVASQSYDLVRAPCKTPWLSRAALHTASKPARSTLCQMNP